MLVGVFNKWKKNYKKNAWFGRSRPSGVQERARPGVTPPLPRVGNSPADQHLWKVSTKHTEQKRDSCAQVWTPLPYNGTNLHLNTKFINQFQIKLQ